jgi:hypothetical protein
MQESEKHDRSLYPGLTAALRALARDDAATGASPRVEARLLAEVRSIARTRRRRTYAAALALAAALLLAVAVSMWRITAGRTPPAAPATRAGASGNEVRTAFFPLLYSNIPATNVQIVRLEVPRTALASFGLASPDSMYGTSPRTVLADVLVGDDGLARAVRFVRAPPRQE